MTVLKKLFDFYINSSIHVALGVVALTIVSMVHFTLSLDLWLLVFVFLGTISGYNFVKYAGIAKLHHRSLARNLRVIQIFSLISFLGLCYAAFQVEFRVILVAAILGFLTALYALPVFSGKKNLRDVAGLKVFVIALIWAGVTVLFPVVDAESPFGWSVVLEFCQRFLFVLILILPFEIRDLKYDRESLGTLPQKLGVEKVKVLGYVLIALWIGLEFLKANASSTSILAILFAAGFTAFAVYHSDEDQSPYFASFWIEGIPILWMAFLLVLSYF